VAEGEVEGEGGTEFVSWWAGNHLLGVYNLMALFPLGYTGSSAVSALSKSRYLVGCRILALLRITYQYRYEK
jgi:hypothetical protein